MELGKWNYECDDKYTIVQYNISTADMIPVHEIDAATKDSESEN